MVDIQQEEGTVVAKFSRTSEAERGIPRPFALPIKLKLKAFEAQQKLTLGPDVVIEPGSQQVSTSKTQGEK